MLEGIAIDAYRRAGLDPQQPVSTLKLARLLHGPETIMRVPSLLGGRQAALCWVNGTPRIALRKCIPLDYLGHCCGHELAHVELGRPHDGDPDLEGECDYLASCFMATRPAALSLHRAFGWELREIANEVVATQTWAALRLGETLLVPVAAVSPTTVRVRGPEETSWPDEATIRSWARRPGPGLRKIRIDDQRGRAAIVADEV